MGYPPTRQPKPHLLQQKVNSSADMSSLTSPFVATHSRSANADVVLSA